MNNIEIKASMEYPTGPPSSSNRNISKLRCRTMKWHTEANWHWSVVFTDAFSQLQAIILPSFVSHKCPPTSHALLVWNAPNGPNGKQE